MRSWPWASLLRVLGSRVAARTNSTEKRCTGNELRQEGRRRGRKERAELEGRRRGKHEEGEEEKEKNESKMLSVQ